MRAVFEVLFTRSSGWVLLVLGGIVYLAKTNTISAGFQTTTIENGTTTANAAIVAADCNGNPGARSPLHPY